MESWESLVSDPKFRLLVGNKIALTSLFLLIWLFSSAYPSPYWAIEEDDSPVRTTETTEKTKENGIETVEKKPIESESWFKKRKLKDGKYIEQALLRAEEYFFQKRYNIALKLFEKVLQLDPENLNAYRYAGDIFIQQNKLEKAKKYFETALELSAKPEKEYLRIAQIYILQEKAEKAIQALEKALEYRDDMYLCYFYLGLVHLKFRKEKEMALVYWKSYLDHLPEKEGAERENMRFAIVKLEQALENELERDE